MNFSRYVVLACARCGSTWLDQLIASHPCAISQHENLAIKDNAVVGAGASPDEWRAAQDAAFAKVEAEARAVRHKRQAFAGCDRVFVGGKLPYEKLYAIPDCSGRDKPCFWDTRDNGAVACVPGATTRPPPQHGRDAVARRVAGRGAREARAPFKVQLLRPLPLAHY